MAKTFEQKLRSLAEVAVKVGVGLQPEQKLLLGTPVEALGLARLVVEEAYKAGSKLVVTNINDEQLNKIRYEFAPRDSFEQYPTWRMEGLVKAVDDNYAMLNISADDPELLKGQDPELIRKASLTAAKHNKPLSERISGFAINWCLVSAATPAWARMVFPNEPQAWQMELLWDAIFKVSRADLDDPIGAWRAHSKALDDRVKLLNQKRYAAIHFRGPGTDLRVGLADGHLWAGGAGTAKNGALCVPNIPTEEVFTTPHKDRVDGVVSSTKPLSIFGNLIDGIRVRFEKGRVVEASATIGEEYLKNILDTDEGAKHIGEVALVPHSSPVSQSGVLFYNTLFDENAASHIALGRFYEECLMDGHTLTDEQKAAAGANDSLTHVDWMIGSAEIDVDGIGPSGQAEPLMRSGEWVS